ncbi:MAG: endolytic transglycosylase MltG [Gammaproteobacteria bacterium]
MNPIVLINGAKQSKTTVFNRNTQFGDGLFETCVVESKNILFWSYHIARLNKGCQKLGIGNVDESFWLSDIRKALSVSRLNSCVVKIMLSRGESLRGYGFESGIKPVRIVIVSEMPEIKPRQNLTLDFCDSGYASNPKLAGIKHCNRLEQILARADLKGDEGIMLDEDGNIISVTQGNIFSIYANTLHTPRLDKCGIEGTRRAIILEIASELGMQINVGPLSVDGLMESDEVFISNSVMEIQSITQIGDMSFASNGVTGLIRTAFEEKKQSNNAWLSVKKNKTFSRLIKLALILALGVWIWTSKDMLVEDSQIYHLQKGATINVVALDLYNKELINSELYLKLTAMAVGASKKLQAGYYQLEPETSVLSFLNKVTSGDVVRQNVTLIEGVTIDSYYSQLSQNPAVKSKAMFEDVMQSLNIEAPFEGWLFPETYQITYGDSIQSVFLRAHQSMKKQLDELWQTRSDALPFNTPYEAIILASLIEKETAHHQEKSMIAGVFMRRLAEGMRLQADPSVIYALGDAYTGSLTRENLRIKSPYNTYRHEGLPPGAIGSVGYESLYAAFHPDEGNNLYFVSKKDGSHAFAETYQEHKDNIQRYLNN